MRFRLQAFNVRPAVALLAAICALVAAGSLSTGQAQAAVVTCVGVPATIARGGGNDTIYGTSRSDVIVAGAGNDTVYGFGGNDVICGDAGNDRAYGGEGNDYLRGGDGNDLLNGSFGADTLVGVNGGDSLAGGMGNDVLNGGPGNDVLAGGLNNDTIDGGGGQDTVMYPDHPVTADLSSHSATERSWSGPYAHVLGTDALMSIENVWGSPHSDVIHGNGGNNILAGGNGSDTLSGNGYLYGGRGDDSVAGLGLLDCGPGADHVHAGDGSVVVSCEVELLQGLPGPPGRVLVVGDSVSFQTGEGLAAVHGSYNVEVANGGTPGCGFVRGGETLQVGRWVSGSAFCEGWPNRWQSLVNVNNPEVVIVLVGFWDVFDRRLPDGRVLEFGTHEADQYVESELNLALDVLTSGGAKVLLLTTPYFAPAPDGQARSARDRERVDHINELYRGVAAQRDGQIDVVGLHELLTPDGFRDAIYGVSMRGDGVHLTPAGKQHVARWLAPKLVESIASMRDTPVSQPSS